MRKHIRLVHWIVENYHQNFTEILNWDSEKKREVIKAMIEGKNAKLYKTLVGHFIYVGGSDAAHDTIWENAVPKPTFNRLKTETAKSKCPKLHSFSDFVSCGYNKTKKTCKMPRHYKSCPLPKYNLKNGKWNRMVFSTFLFLRDHCENDFFSYVQSFLGTPKSIKLMGREDLRIRTINLIKDMDKIFNVGPKLANMLMSDLFHQEVGKWRYYRVHKNMIVVDSLVHNFLHRTGILNAYDMEHDYNSSRCHRPGGCAEIIEKLSGKIDCSQFKAKYPSFYPRMVQHAIWNFCTEQCSLNYCKTEEPDTECEVSEWCELIPLP